MDCCVCLEPTDTRVGPCDHAVCSGCARRWFAREPACPMCRRDVYGLRDAAGDDALVDGNRTVIPLDRGRRAHAGVTLVNDAAGVRVTKVKACDEFARNHVRVGRKIRAINGIPTRDHRAAVRIIQACTEAGASASLQ